VIWDARSAGLAWVAPSDIQAPATCGVPQRKDPQASARSYGPSSAGRGISKPELHLKYVF